MSWRRLRGFVAGLIAVGLVAAGITAGWMVMTSGVLASQPTRPDTAGSRLTASPEGLQAENPAPLSATFQISQPRDPFRPLINEGSTTGDIPGIGGTPGGEPDDGFTPSATTITLKEIREVSGVLRATVVVGTVSYEVGVGDTFAVSYKVVSLTETKGVFSFGDSAFELSVGQQILK